jgi:hypothetical protein
MKRLISILASLLLSLAAVVAEFPVGQWSNKQEGFKIVTFGLRSDGKGFFSPSMSQLTTVVRWKKEGDSVKITIASPPDNPTAVFLQTTDPKVGKLLLLDQEPQDFYLINEKEPQDMEAMNLARAKDEAEKRADSFSTDKRTIASMGALLEEVRAFANVTEGMGSRTISSGDWPTSIQLTRTNKRISVTIQLEASRVKELTPNVTYAYTKEEPKSDLPRAIYVPQAQRELIKAWALSEGLHHEFAFYQAKGTWGLEGHFAFFATYIDEDPHKVASVVEHLASSVFKAVDGPFVVTETKRK